jgi:hypothetical protein
MMEKRDASAGDMRGLNQAVHGRIDLRGRKLAPARASDCGLRGARSCKYRQRESWDVHRLMQAEISLNTEMLTPIEKFRPPAMFCDERKTCTNRVRNGYVGYPEIMS